MVVQFGKVKTSYFLMKCMLIVIYSERLIPVTESSKLIHTFVPLKMTYFKILTNCKLAYK